MCCLFGLHNYKNTLSRNQKCQILSVLSTACEARGTDATGIAYNDGTSIRIYKRPLPAHQMQFWLPNTTNVIMGHTRMTTQGSETFNPNNHPFPGKAGTLRFSLAHNGVLYNDKLLKKKHRLPKSKIETDSYVAVQLLEQYGELSFSSFRHVAEALEGTFTITVLTERNELYFIKGDNPMCIYHYPELGLYLYASTEEILKKALKQMPRSLGKPERVDLYCGQILCIDAEGHQSRSSFDDSNLYDSFCGPWYRFPSWESPKSHPPVKDEYVDNLKSVAPYYGYDPEQIDKLLDEGFSAEEIEEFLNCGCF